MIRRKTIKHFLMGMTQPTRSRTLNNWNYPHRPVQDWLKLQDPYPERHVLVEEIIVFSDVTTEIVVNFTPMPMWVELVKRSESQSKAKRHESPIGAWWWKEEALIWWEVEKWRRCVTRTYLSTCKNLSKNKLIETRSSLSNTSWQHFYAFWIS